MAIKRARARAPETTICRNELGCGQGLDVVRSIIEQIINK